MKNRNKHTFSIVIYVAFLILYPLLGLAQEVKSFNDSWLFYKGDAGKEIIDVDYNDEKWERIHLPHTWNTDAYKIKKYYQGVGWYRKHFVAASHWKDCQVFLHMEGTSKEAEIYLNERYVGHHAGGYTAASFDITDFLDWDSINVISVKVDNSSREIIPISADFTFFGGIYRDVLLIVTSKQHINLTNMASDGVFIHTPVVSEEKGTIAVRTEVKNDAKKASTLLLQQLIYSPDGELLQTLQKKIKLKARELSKIDLESSLIYNPQLWSPEKPHLYKVETRLSNVKNHKVLDSQTHYIGFRWYKFDASKGFFLNGKPYKLHGVCRHQDQKPIGPALSDEMHRRDFMLMKEMGANFIRISHYPQDKALLEMCDRVGMLVWEEIPTVDVVTESEVYAANCEQNLREMIRQHYNHTSIILWGYMNEILLARGAQAASTEQTIALAKRLEAALKEEDATRLSTMAFHGNDIYNKTGLSEITDVVGWNIYLGWYGGSLMSFNQYMEDQHKRFPNHPIIVSEYGAGSDKRLHSLKPKVFDFSIEYQQKLLEHYQQEIERQPYLCGGTLWNFIDFSSANREESMPRLNNKGLVYTDRTPKDVYYYFKATWRNDIPVLHIASRDWQHRSSVVNEKGCATLPVKVYANMNEVELYANGVSLGKKRLENCTATFDVPFVQQETFLYAKGVWNNQTVEDAMPVCFIPISTTLDCNAIKGVELAVNVGSNCYFTSSESNLTWLPDQAYIPGSWGYVGGKPHNTTGEIHNTNDGPLYQTMRTGLDSYCFDVPEGIYEVEMLFSDVFSPKDKIIYLLGRNTDELLSSQGNSFSIQIDGNMVEKVFNPGVEAGSYQAVKRRYIVNHKEGTLKVVFKAIQGKAHLSAIKLRKL